jgi:Rhodopirellula transposase DDE domain
MPETAGDPMTEQKWVRSSLRQLSHRLKALGHSVSPPTVGRLLRKRGYALRVNVKKQEASAAHPERTQQFEQIETQKQRFQAVGWPIISVDTKKKDIRADLQTSRTQRISTFSLDTP